MSAAASLEVPGDNGPSSLGSLEERTGSNGSGGEQESTDGSVGRRGGSSTGGGGDGENGGVECLGQALAGVSLGGASRSRTETAFSNFSLSGGGAASASETTNASSSTGKSVSGGTTTSATPVTTTSTCSQESSGWGNFADVSVATAETAFGNGSTGNHHHHHGGSGHHHSSADSSSRDGGTGGSDDHTESLKLFLSRDPSQSLGDGVFQLSHPNLTSMSAAHDENNSTNSNSNPVSTNASSAFRLNGHGLATGLGGRSNSNAKTSSSSNSLGAAGNNNTKNASNGASTTGGGPNRGIGAGTAAGTGSEGGRTESPSSAVTVGTNSTTRSASSYSKLNNGGTGTSTATSVSVTAGAPTAAGTIQAFQPYDTSMDGSNATGGAGAPNPHLMVPGYSSTFASGGPLPPSSPAYNASTTSGSSPYRDKNNKPTSYQQQQPHHPQPHQFHPQQQPQLGMNNNDYATGAVPPPLVDPAPAQPGQVLYMAVQSPDGRGQVLQPVQMVQLPGKQMAYVVAGPAGMAPPPPPPDAAGIDPYGSGGGGSTSGVGGLAAATSLGAIGGTPDLIHPTSSRNNTAVGGNPNANTNGAGGAPGGRGIHVGGAVGGGGAAAGYGGTPPIVADMGRSYSESRASSSSQDVVSDYTRNTTVAAGAGGQQFHSDPAIASLYASPQRPPLDALLGQVRRLSRDQVGCRLVQQALDEEGPMAASLILQEGLPFWGEAMVDPFGNYLFQKILEKVTAEERVMLVKSVSTRLVNASLNLHGTRSVQKVVELCAADEQQPRPQGSSESGESAADILTDALSPAAARLCIDSHGNHVIQRIILKLGSEHSEFVFDAVAASVGDVARHRHGCCVIQRCLDSAPSEARSHLVHRIVEKALELMQDAYGNYVVQYVLDVCSDEDVHAVCESVVGKVNLLAIQKFSSNVMEKCLERCSERVKECYMKEMSDHERVRELMMDPFGNYVVQRALSVATHAQAIRLVEAMRPHLVTSTTPPLGGVGANGAGSVGMGGMGPAGGQRNGGVRNTAGGRRIIAKICRRFPNFSLTPGEQDLYRRNHHHHHHHANGGNAPQGVNSPVGGGGGGGHHNHHQQHPQHHHHQQQHHQQQHHSSSSHEELYSRNRGRYQQQQQHQNNNAMSNAAPGGHPLTAAAGPAPSYAAVGGPPHHESFLRAPVPPDLSVGLRGAGAGGTDLGVGLDGTSSGYGALLPPQAAAPSYYNPLGIGGGPLAGVAAASPPSYYDPFNINEAPGALDGSIGGTYM